MIGDFDKSAADLQAFDPERLARFEFVSFPYPVVETSQFMNVDLIEHGSKEQQIKH